MQFVFMNVADEVLFVRDDAETASWTAEEMSLTADFPFVDDKIIEIDQRIVFVDYTGETQIFEVRNAKTIEPDHFQQITAEHICISELTDDHIDEQKLTDVTCSSALTTVLTGTLWTVGTVNVNPTITIDINRGSVWQAVLDIQSNANVYIEPHVTISETGEITRSFNVTDTGGAWHGLRLSIDKNMIDPSVTFDDTELVTALYGYGGTINGTSQEEEDRICTFADVVWTQTDEHPAKPEGQLFIEDPEATELYGRNGRARFGFYQNTEITDPDVLLQKTWETLKTVSDPTISIEGTVADLYRLGYVDEPIRLHDIALVEVLPAGFKRQLQIIRMTVNLLDPTETTLSIGAYIPNIVYIDRDLDNNVTGSRGGGGNKSGTVNEWREFRTTIQQFADGTGLRIQAVQNDINDQTQEIAKQSGRIDVAYDHIEAEVKDRRDADNELTTVIEQTASSIRQEASAANSTIYSVIEQTASNITSEVASTESGLRSYIEQTASGIRQRIVSTTNQTWIQDNDPRSEGGGSHEVKVGDIWIKSTHQGTWDGADGFDWGWDEQYDWFAIQGAQVYGWQNGKWELVSDQQQVITWSDVVDTAEHAVTQKIKGIVNDEGLLEVYLSKLEQTATEIKAEVSTADSAIYSFIDQTASQIELAVAYRPAAVIQTDEPTTIQGRPVKENDIWVQSNFKNTWDAVLDDDWSNDDDLSWGEVRSDKIYIRHDGAWHEAVDGTVIAEDADIREQAGSTELLAKRINVLDGEVKANYAGLKVDAQQIRSYVQERVNGLGSSITQTATQIRAEVHAANSQVYSAITQTASNILLEVANVESGLQSSILQTASGIRMDVSAANSRIYSSIQQTASGIRTEVSNKIAGVNSSIAQTASSIRAEVNASNSLIYSSIEQTASSIRSTVNDKIAGVSSQIEQTASRIRVEVNSANSLIYSVIESTASSIRTEVASTESGLISTIEQTASRIRSDVSASNSAIYSSIEQTASRIRSEVASTESGIRSTITQTASGIRSDVSASNSAIYSFINQTASGIRSDVASTESGLRSSITQNADRIALVVEQDGAGNDKIKTASIVAGINEQSGSYVKISAATINLSGYVTADQLSVTDAKIENLTSGATTASTLRAYLVSASTGFNYQGHSLSFKTVTISGTTYHLLGY